MFLEVYAVKRSEYIMKTDIAKKDENRRLIETTGVRIRCSRLFPDRAEIILPNKTTLLAAGSYEDLVQRLVNAKGNIARI